MSVKRWAVRNGVRSLLYMRIVELEIGTACLEKLRITPMRKRELSVPHCEVALARITPRMTLGKRSFSICRSDLEKRLMLKWRRGRYIRSTY